MQNIRHPIILLIMAVSLANHSSQSRSIFPKLGSVCPTSTYIKSQIAKGTDYAILWGNVNRFETQLAQAQAKLIGKDRYGYLFQFDYKLSLPNSLENIFRQDAIKMVHVNEDSTTKEGSLKQTILKKEIQASMILSVMDEHRLFFPKYRQCVEITDDMKMLAGNPQTVNRQMLTLPNGIATFIFFQELVDFNLSSFMMKARQKKGPMFSLPNRINLCLNAMQGMLFMRQKFVHCDLNSENLMLRGVSEEEAVRLNSQGIRDIELGVGESYQLMFVDLGMVSGNNLNNLRNTRCSGGTLGFIGDEYFKASESHAEIDTFSLGITMIDLELAALEYDSLSSFFYYSQKLKSQQLQSEERLQFDDTLIGMVGRSVLMQKLIGLMDSEDHVAEIREKVQEIYPQMLNYLSNVKDDFVFDAVLPSNLLFENGECFEALVIATLEKALEDQLMYRDYESKEAELSMLQTVIQSEEAVKIKDLNSSSLSNTSNSSALLVTEYFESMNRMLTKGKKLKSKYFSILLKMILPVEERLHMRSGFDQLDNVLKEYKRENQNDLKVIDETEVDSRLNSFEGDSISRDVLNLSLKSRMSRRNSIYNGDLRLRLLV